MTPLEFKNLIKTLTSRAIILTGLGCIEVYVPVKSKKAVEEYLYNTLPTQLHVEIKTLRDNKISLKKGVFEFGKIGCDDTGHFFDLVAKYNLCK